MDRGEVYLAPFTYSDQQRTKRRPACVVSVPSFNAGPDVLLAMITSSRMRLANPGIGDVVLTDWRGAGLLQASVVRTGRLLAMERSRVVGPIGRLSAQDLTAVGEGLRLVLGLA